MGERSGARRGRAVADLVTTRAAFVTVARAVDTVRACQSLSESPTAAPSVTARPTDPIPARGSGPEDSYRDRRPRRAAQRPRRLGGRQPAIVVARPGGLGRYRRPVRQSANERGRSERAREPPRGDA